ncbi:hypothetical protein [Micromonospora sp. NPDC093277]|uniref:hypothetical protein n=1 Tax=Micromonospora sp. NPDC093277 TaxID=3364291 RepID=UPI0037FE5F65
MRIRLSTVLAGLLGLATALSVAAPPAQAAPTKSTATIASQLVLEPTDFGYRGSVQVELTYRGAAPGRARYVITEPIPGSYYNEEWGVTCYSGGELLPDHRTRVECDVPGGELTPGERRVFTVDFRVLTTVQPYAMKAGNGQLDVTVDGRAVTSGKFSTLFRATTGSLANPKQYVRDERPDVSVSVTGGVTLVRQPDGTFAGRMPVTLRYNGDAPHNSIWYEARGLPEGVWEPWIEGCVIGCVPGDAFMEGEVRTFEFLVEARPGTALGEVGDVTVEFFASTSYPAPDLNPADNLVTFPVTVTEAA